MPYLKTVLTYNQPSEAEVDKAFLESHGMSVCLLNANTSRNELGVPFYIQLQVMENEYAEARRILREANPARFGSPERVAELDRQIKQGMLRFVLGALPVAIAVFYLIPEPVIHPMRSLWERQPVDFRLGGAVLAGVAAGTLCALALGGKKVKREPGAGDSTCEAH
jgi:hypothetical protein